MAAVEAAREKASAAISDGKFSDAVKHYSTAIDLSPSNSKLYCDRAAAYLALSDFDAALSDAKKSVELNSTCRPAAFEHLGSAYFGLGKHSEAVSAYEKGLRISPNNQSIKTVLDRAKAKIDELNQKSSFGPKPNNEDHHKNDEQNQKSSFASPPLPFNQKIIGLFGSPRPVRSDQKDNHEGSSWSSNPIRLFPTDNTSLSGKELIDYKMKAVANRPPSPSTVLDAEPSKIWPAMENLHVPAIKKRHLNLPPSEIINEVGVHAWKAFQGALSSVAITNKAIKKIEKEKEALFQHLNETTHSLKAEEAKATRLQAKVAELEKALAKMNETYGNIGAYFSWKSRIEMMEEFTKGEHLGWNLEKTKAEFLATFPPGLL